jgi:hypothetical protein
MQDGKTNSNLKMLGEIVGEIAGWVVAVVVGERDARGGFRA